jgi:hypothetical protein
VADVLRHLRPILACLATLIAFAAAAAPAAFGATTYAPNRFDDPISGGTDCTAPAPPNGCSLRGAIAAANTGDTVQLAPGTYTLTQSQLLIAHDITLAGAGMRDTTIKQTALDRVIRDTTNTLTIEGLTVTGGHVVGSNGPNGSSPGAAGGSAGGSAVSFSATLKLTDVLVTANLTVAGNGGNGAAAAPGTGGNGGYAGSAISGGASLTIVRSEIFDNGALGGLGGNGADGTGSGSGGVGGTSGGADAAISTGLSSTITITDSLISGNVATPGNAGHGGKGGPSGGSGGAGGLGNQPAEGGGLFTNGHLDMTNVTMTANVAGGSAGGAGGAGVKAGTAGGAGGIGFGGNGGALGLLNGAAARLDAVTLSANKTTTPAAAALGGAAGAGGVAGSAGGLNTSAGGNIEIYSATLALRNTIVAGGVAADPTALNCDFGGGATLTDTGHNIDDGHSCISIVALGDHRDTPPLIADLADNGGPTRTVALLVGSPALGGVGGPCVQLNGATPLDHDQRGLVRANPCDIGAFQHQNPQVTLEPTIDGLPQVGQTMTCQRAGASGDLPFTHAIQWLLDGNPIVGQTTGSYAPVVGDIGHALSCTDTISNIYGSASATSLVVTVDPPPPPPSGPADQGGAGGPGPTRATTPKLTKLRVSPSSIRRGHKGHVTFTLSAAAKVTFKLQRKTRGTKVGKACVKRTHSHRHGASCTRLVAATGAPKAASAKQGSDSVSWTPSKSLSPGSYVLTATPAHGHAVTKTFTIRR